MGPLLKLSLVIGGIVAALCVGMFLGGNPKYLPQDLRDVFVEDDRALRAEIIDAIEDGYYKKVDEDALNQARQASYSAEDVEPIPRGLCGAA